MQVPEVALVLVAIVLLLRLAVAPGLAPSLPTRAIVIATVAAIVLDLIVDGPRWQLVPAYLVLAVLLLAAPRQKPTHLAWRIIGAGVCGLLMLTSAYLAVELPVLRLPAPDGPYAVGSFFSSLTDDSRIETFRPPAKRELAVEVWYPAAKSQQTGAYPAQSLWSELYTGPYDLLSFFTAYLGRVHTHSHLGIPIAESAAPFPVLLYDSGLGWTSQNTLLMEHMASHGYVVVSISHPYDQLKVRLPRAGTVLIDPAGDAADKAEFSSAMYGTFQRVWFEMAWMSKGPRRTQLAVAYLSLCDDVAGLSDPAQRKALIGKVLQGPDLSPIQWRDGVDSLDTFCRVLNGSKDRSVARQLADTVFVADHLPDIKAPIDGFSRSLNLQRLGAFGHSEGGAIAGEFCKIDARCKAGLNIDGAQFGGHWKAPFQAPFAMLYSARQDGLNDFAFPAARYDHLDYVVADAGHADFLDAGLVAPLLKQLARGPLSFEMIPARQMTAITDWTVLTFFDHYLKGEPADLTPPVRFPQLTMSLTSAR